MLPFLDSLTPRLNLLSTLVLSSLDFLVSQFRSLRHPIHSVLKLFNLTLPSHSSSSFPVNLSQTVHATSLSYYRLTFFFPSIWDSVSCSPTFSWTTPLLRSRLASSFPLSKLTVLSHLQIYIYTSSTRHPLEPRFSQEQNEFVSSIQLVLSSVAEARHHLRQKHLN